MKYFKPNTNLLCLTVIILSVINLMLSTQQSLNTKHVYAQTSSPSSTDWYMSGANPQRTSWVSTSDTNQTEIIGPLKPEWYVPVEPYIHPKFQIIATLDTVFLSTSRGLYAFDAASGDQKWVYATELPLGNSPTIYNNIAYVGGYDRKIHAINAIDGNKIWTYEAGSGFDTSPLVIENTVYMGSRDGYMYALNATTGDLRWRYKTDGPILYSAAAKSDNSAIYFASDDGHGYALNASSGTLVWKTAKLPGQGFHSWWAVYYSHPTQGDYIIFSGEWNSRSGLRPGVVASTGGVDILEKEWDDLYPDRYIQSSWSGGPWVAPKTATPVPGDWAAGTVTMDASKPNPMGSVFTTAVTEYFEEPSASEKTNDPAGLNRTNHKAWRRLYLVTHAATGQEVQYDFDGDGLFSYAPITAGGYTHFGNRFPPIVGIDKVLYQTMDYISTPHIPAGGMVGWKINTPYLSQTAYMIGGVDQPSAFAAGGKYVYYADLVDRQAGAFDITDPTRQNAWVYYNENHLPLKTLAPDYNLGYVPNSADNEVSPCCGDVYLQAFGGLNGVYGKHSMAQNPPIPYKGRVYMHKGNSLIAFKAGAVTAIKKPTASIISSSNYSPVTSKEIIRTKLRDEVSKMIQAGHLKPGMIDQGQSMISQIQFLGDYFHTPFDTLYTLLRARPLLQDASMVAQLDTYIQSEFTNYNPATINHIGWKDGTWRDDFITTPETTLDITNFPKTNNRYSPYSTMWDFNPMAWYAMWIYAKQYGNAAGIFQSGKNSAPLTESMMRIMNGTVTNTQLAEFPWIHNGYLAGLIGYSNLFDLAKETSPTIDGNIGIYTITQVKTRKDQLLTLRAQNITRNTAWPLGWGDKKERAINSSRQFIYLVPELADYLRTTDVFCADNKVSLECIRDIVDRYNTIAPYWFVPKFDVSYTESAFQPLYDYNSLFQAKGLILKQSFEELTKYLEAPIFVRGDLFYIQNLITALEAPSEGTATPTPTILPGDINGDRVVNILDYTLLSNNFGTNNTSADLNVDGIVNILDYTILSNNFGKSG